MARRRRTSGFEDFVTVLARLPWWVCLAMAPAMWLILSPIANSPMDVSGATLDQMGGIVVEQLLRTFAYFGQYLIPLACILSTIVSTVSR